jgi:hypothetical protein
MRRVPAKKTKHKKPTRKEVLKGIDWKPIELPGCPSKVVEAENRRIQDHIVGWVQGLAAHIDKYEQAQEAARQSADLLKYPASVQVEVDSASVVGVTMAKLRATIDRADLAGKAVAAQTDITVRGDIIGSDLAGLRNYLRSLDPFEITFGEVGFLPASVKNPKAVLLKVDVISGLLEGIHVAMEQHAICREEADFDYQPHAVVAYVKPRAVKKYVGNKLLVGRRIEVSTMSIRLKGGESEFVQLIDAPAPWKEYDYIWPGDEVKPPQRRRPKSSPSRTGTEKRPKMGNQTKSP